MKKIKKILSTIMMLTCIMASLNCFTWFVQSSSNIPDQISFSSEFSTSLPNFLGGRLPYIDPELASINEPARVMIIVKDSADFSQIASHMISCRITPAFSGVRLILGTVNAENLGSIIANENAVAILKDREVNFIGSPREKLREENFQKKSLQLQSDILVSEASPNGSSHDVNMREVAEIMNATDVWMEYGVTGKDVSIAIIDTGVDYGSLGLGYWDVMARDMFGYPAAFDADAMCLVYTNVTLTAFSNASGTFIPTTGLDPLVYVLGDVYRFSEVFGYVFPSDMNVAGILTDGETCHWGVMFQWLFGLDMFPVLVVDSDTDGVYDTVYVDI